MMGIAQGMEDAFESEIRSEVVMDEHARHARDDLAAFDGHQVERQQGSRCHLEPAQGTADA